MGLGTAFYLLQNLPIYYFNIIYQIGTKTIKIRYSIAKLCNLNAFLAIFKLRPLLVE